MQNSRTEQADALGALLMALRQARGLSPTQLARDANIARATLYNWERGRVQPRLPELEAALRALNAAPDERTRALALHPASAAPRRLPEIEAPSLLMPHGGDLLRALRLRRGWTQAQEAHYIKVSQTTIARWERGEAWPHAEPLHQLCCNLRARAEESAVLTRGPFALAGQPRGTEETTTHELQETRLREIQQRLHAPNCHALGDLLYPSLEAQTVPLARRGEAGRLLLARILLCHAGYLSERCQPSEAGRAAERALTLLPERGEAWNDLRLRADMYWTVWKCPLRAHARQLHDWLSRPLPLASRLWVMGQIAASLVEQNEGEQALYLDRDALVLTTQTGDAQALTRRNNSYAEHLLAVGRASEAAELLTITEGMTPPIRLRFQLTLSEAHLAAGNRGRAQDWLNAACDSNKILQLAYYLPQINALAAQL